MSDRPFREPYQLDSASLLPAENASIRSYLHVLRKDGVALMSGGLGVIFAFLAAYYEWFVKHGKLSLWIIAALAFFFASYRTWAAERRRYLALHEKRRTEINQYLESGLRIDYRPRESGFIQEIGPVKQYRISVQSLIDVPNVEVVVNHFKVGDLPVLHNLHLRPMHDRDIQSGTKRIKLHARKENYWDVVTEFGGAAMESGRTVVQLNCIPSLGQYDLEPNYYEFELMATGDGVPEATKIVRLIVKADEVTSFELRDGRLSKTESLVIPVSASA